MTTAAQPTRESPGHAGASATDSSARELQVVALGAGLTHYAADWTRLIRAGHLNPSLLPGWTAIVADNSGIASRVKLLVQRHADEVTGLIPYYVQRARILGVPLTKLSLTSNLVSYHAELSCSGERTALLRALLQAEPGWQVLQLDNILPDGPTAVALEQLCREIDGSLLTYPVDFAPYLPIEQPWDKFLASMDKKFRYKYRKRQESLGAHTGLSMRWFTSVDDVGPFLAAMLDVEARSWKASEGVAVSNASHEGSYYAKLLPFLAGEGALLANVLFKADTPVAYNLCCCYHGWVGQLKTAFDVSLEQLSPGALVIDAAIRAAFEQGAREFDFLGTPGKSAPEPHKLFWTKHVRSHKSYFLFAPRPLSRLVAALKRWRQPDA